MSDETLTTAQPDSEAVASTEAPAVPETPAAPAAPVVPEKYELKLPEGSTLDPAAIERTATTARELGLSNDAAQKALEMVASEFGVQQEALVEAHKPGGAEWTKRVKEWEGQALADKDIGGGSTEALQRNAELGKRVLATFFPDGVHDFLHETGYGSHPDILKGLIRIGKAMSEGTLVMPGTQAATTRDPAELFYGKSNKTTE